MSLAVRAAMSMCKRQRFSVELCQDHITVISWTRLLADAKRVLTTSEPASEAAAPSRILHATTIPGAQPYVRIATIRENLHTATSNLLESRGKLKRDVSNSIKKPAKLMLERKHHREGRNVVKSSPSRAPERGSQVHPASNVKRIIEAKTQFDDESMAMKLARPKGKVHRSLPIASEKTSYRTKSKTKARFCCSKKDPDARSKLKLSTRA